MTGLGPVSGEEHQFEFVGAGTVLLQSSETLMPEQAAGVLPDEPGVPGAGGVSRTGGQQAGAPSLPGQLGGLQRRFGL
jgi:hypothetical protein